MPMSGWLDTGLVDATTRACVLTMCDSRLMLANHRPAFGLSLRMRTLGTVMERSCSLACWCWWRRWPARGAARHGSRRSRSVVWDMFRRSWGRRQDVLRRDAGRDVIVRCGGTTTSMAAAVMTSSATAGRVWPLLRGGRGNDRIATTAANTVLEGGPGRDYLSGAPEVSGTTVASRCMVASRRRLDVRIRCYSIAAAAPAIAGMTRLVTAKSPAVVRARSCSDRPVRVHVALREGIGWSAVRVRPQSHVAAGFLMSVGGSRF